MVTRGLDDGERAPPSLSGSTEAGAAVTKGHDDGERAPPGGSAEARAATMGVRDDGERSAISRELVAKGGACRTGSQIQWGAGWPADRRGPGSPVTRHGTLEGGNGGWRGHRGGRDDQAAAKLRQAVSHQRDNGCSREWGLGSMINSGGGPTEAGKIRRSGTPASRRAQRETRKAVGDADFVGDADVLSLASGASIIVGFR